jgi:anti-sigma B factor antagonist
MNLVVDIASHASGVTLELAGDMDLATAGLLAERTAELFQSQPDGGADLTVDMSGVRFCDSAGISALVALRKQCEEHGWSLRTVHPQPAVRRILVDFTGLGDYLNIL